MHGLLRLVNNSTLHVVKGYKIYSTISQVCCMVKYDLEVNTIP